MTDKANKFVITKTFILLICATRFDPTGYFHGNNSNNTHRKVFKTFALF